MIFFTQSRFKIIKNLINYDILFKMQFLLTQFIINICHLESVMSEGYVK